MPHPSMSGSLPLVGDGRAGLTSMTLLEQVKLCDHDAWQRLTRLYTPLLRHWCRSWGVGVEDTDDVLQEIFQAIFSSLKDFRREREGDSFRAWLRGVARHKTLSFVRRRGSPGQGGTDFYERSLLVPDPNALPIDEDEGRFVGAMYRDALRLVREEFEERTWQIFWRVTVEGQAPAVLAEDLGVTAASIRKTKSRVLRRLKDVLGEPTRAVIPPAG